MAHDKRYHKNPFKAKNRQSKIKKQREQELSSRHRKNPALKQKVKYSILALRLAVPSSCLPIA